MSVLLPGTLAAAGVAILIYRRFRSTSNEPLSGQTPPRGYVLANKVTHGRILPVESAHHFAYQTLSLFVSLDALENHKLDLGRGALFKYGSTLFTVSGIHANAYLGQSPAGGKPTIKEKLGAVLSSRGYDSSQLQDAWMQTMPSYFGFEGINPLTVYYCYADSDRLWLVVLEVKTIPPVGLHILTIRLCRSITRSENNTSTSWNVERMKTHNALKGKHPATEC